MESLIKQVCAFKNPNASYQYSLGFNNTNFIMDKLGKP